MGRIMSFGTVYKIQDLNVFHKKKLSYSRDKTKVVIIDDEDFVFFEELRRSGFNITQYHDVEDLQTLGEFDVIICDIKGVGKKFNTKSEGAYLLRELKKKYPYKVFAAYTGSSHKLHINEYLDGISIIKKDIEVEDWCSEIENLIKKSKDPIYLWGLMREQLFKHGISTLDIARIEHEYTNTILNKKCDFSHFPSKKYEFNEDLKLIIKAIIGLLSVL